MNRKMDNLGRITLPIELRKQLGIENNEELNIELIENKIVLSKVKPIEGNIKTKYEIEEHLHNLNELVKIGLDDEKLLGSIEALQWVLDTERNPNNYLNDYDDLEKKEEME